MECGIIGLPASGKTTLFNALTGLSADPYGDKPNVGVAQVPDPRLAVIAQYIETRKIVHATIQYVDIPGVTPGSGAQKANAFLSHARQVDAVCHVVNCFEISDAGAIVKNIQDLETELVLADLQVVESARDKAARVARSGDAEAKARVALMDKIAEPLNEALAIRSITDFSVSESAMLKSYGMITAKPVLYLANVSEGDEPDSEAAGAVAKFAAEADGQSIAACASLEAELSELEDTDRLEMLESLGLTEPALARVARSAYALLGYMSFYTAGDKEIRAWPVRLGATAPEAAGAIHSDMQRGFIRAECYSVDELVEHQSEKAIRAAGKLRSEGKNYQLRDADVVHFLFNV